MNITLHDLPLEVDKNRKIVPVTRVTKRDTVNDIYLNIIELNNLTYQVIGTDLNYPTIQFSGTKEELFPLLYTYVTNTVIMSPYDEIVNFKKIYDKWDGENILDLKPV